MIAVVVTADRVITEHDIDPDLQTMRAIIGGGWLEPIGPQQFDPEVGAWVGYVDEDGGPKGLPLNQTATLIALAAGWPGAMMLRGTVIFLGRDSSEDIDAPEPFRRLVAKLGRLEP